VETKRANRLALRHETIGNGEPELPYKAWHEKGFDCHALRATFATFIVESGASVKEAQTMLRHSNPNITMNTYAKVRPGRLNEVAERVAERALNGNGKANFGHEKAVTGQTLAPKWPQWPLLPKNGDSVTIVTPATYNGKIMVEAAGIEPAAIKMV
jgi:hypothetical protein